MGLDFDETNELERATATYFHGLSEVALEEENRLGAALSACVSGDEVEFQ